MLGAETTYLSSYLFAKTVLLGKVPGLKLEFIKVIPLGSYFSQLGIGFT